MSSRISYESEDTDHATDRAYIQAQLIKMQLLDEIQAEQDAKEGEEEMYKVIWETGTLRLVFGMDSTGQAVIRKKLGSTNGIAMVRVGDVLKSINGISVKGIAYTLIMKHLSAPQLPMTLVFQDPHEQVRDVYKPSLQMSVKSASTTTTGSASTSFIEPKDRPLLYTPSSSGTSCSSEDLSVEYNVEWNVGVRQNYLIHQRDDGSIACSPLHSATADNNCSITEDDSMVLINGLPCEIMGFQVVTAILDHCCNYNIIVRFRRASVVNQVDPIDHAENNHQLGDREVVEHLRDSWCVANSNTSTINTALAPREYAVLWREGSLGVEIRERSPTDKSIVVKALVKCRDSIIRDQINVGDKIVRIAGIDVSSAGLASVFTIIETLQKPIAVVFERGTDNDGVRMDRQSHRKSRRSPTHSIEDNQLPFRSSREYLSLSVVTTARSPTRPYSAVDTSDTNDTHAANISRLRQLHLEADRQRNKQCRVVVPESSKLWIRWSNGSLGIAFQQRTGRIVVSRLTGSGTSRGLDQLSPGDHLVSISDYSTQGMRMNEALDLLVMLPKPVELCFHKG